MERSTHDVGGQKTWVKDTALLYGYELSPFPAWASQIIFKLLFLVALESLVHMKYYVEAQSVKQIGNCSNRRQLLGSRLRAKEAFPSGV